MRFVFSLLVLALAGCASSLPRGVELIPRHQDAPEGCRERARVEAKSARSWWDRFASPVSHEHQAREKLLRRAGKAGADTVYVTAYRAYRGEHRGNGIVRVEIEGQALKCAQG